MVQSLEKSKKFGISNALSSSFRDVLATRWILSQRQHQHQPQQEFIRNNRNVNTMSIYILTHLLNICEVMLNIKININININTNININNVNLYLDAPSQHLWGCAQDARAPHYCSQFATKYKRLNKNKKNTIRDGGSTARNKNYKIQNTKYLLDICEVVLKVRGHPATVLRLRPVQKCEENMKRKVPKMENKLRHFPLGVRPPPPFL